jgi:hypothetical protein
MTRLHGSAFVLALALGQWSTAPAGAWDRGNVETLAVLPDVAPGVQSGAEGLTVGPDGIMLDAHDNIRICSNQGDEIVVIDKTGKVIAKLGDFEGIDANGIARGLLFPASLDFSKDGSTLYLPYAGADLAVDSAWTLKVRGFTVSKLRARIPPLADGK